MIKFFGPSIAHKIVIFQNDGLKIKSNNNTLCLMYMVLNKNPLELSKLSELLRGDLPVSSCVSSLRSVATDHRRASCSDGHYQTLQTVQGKQF